MTILGLAVIGVIFLLFFGMFHFSILEGAIERGEWIPAHGLTKFALSPFGSFLVLVVFGAVTCVVFVATVALAFPEGLRADEFAFIALPFAVSACFLSGWYLALCEAARKSKSIEEDHT